MRQLPSRFRRLDDALASLPLDEPMLLSELDGFLTGILLSPEPIVRDEWMQSVWGSDADGEPPFEDPADTRWFVDAVTARHGEIARSFDRGKPEPIFEIDERNGDVLWELWIDGFAQAMALRLEGWDAIADGADATAAEALAALSLLIAVAMNESELDSVAINALQDRAPGELIDVLLRIHAARPGGAILAPIAPLRPPKVGRNDPCRCGSGRKSKRCCG